ALGTAPTSSGGLLDITPPLRCSSPANQQRRRFWSRDRRTAAIIHLIMQARGWACPSATMWQQRHLPRGLSPRGSQTAHGEGAGDAPTSPPAPPLGSRGGPGRSAG